MVLLSPLVSALTQFWMWLSNARATRLKVGLAGLIQQLDGDAYESFEAIEITGLPAGAAVTFQQPAGIPPIVTHAGIPYRFGEQLVARDASHLDPVESRRILLVRRAGGSPEAPLLARQAG